MSEDPSPPWEENAKTNVQAWGLQDPPALALAMGEELGELTDEILKSSEIGEHDFDSERGRDLLRRLSDLGEEIQIHLETVTEDSDGEPIPPRDRPRYLTAHDHVDMDVWSDYANDELNDLMALGYQFRWALQTLNVDDSPPTSTDGGEDIPDTLDIPPEERAGPGETPDLPGLETESEPERIPVTLRDKARADIHDSERCDGADGYDCQREDPSLTRGEDEMNVTEYGPGSDRSGERRVLCGDCRKRQDAVQLSEQPDLAPMFTEDEISELHERFPDILTSAELETDGGDGE